MSKLVESTKQEIEKMEFRKPASNSGLSLDHGTFEEWLNEHVMSVHVKKPGSENWLNSIVRLSDYIVNPVIEKKNSLILQELANSYLPQLEMNPGWFKELEEKLAK